MTKKFIAESGWSEVGLLSLSTADYSQIEPLVKCLRRSSPTGASRSRCPRCGPRPSRSASPTRCRRCASPGFTFAPETGSDRLRRVINKTFTNADMIAAADVAFARGWDLIKVYTMIGLPTETDEDLDELVTLRRGHPRAGTQARPQGGQRLRRLLRAEVLDALPVGALRRRRRRSSASSRTSRTASGASAARR